MAGRMRNFVDDDSSSDGGFEDVRPKRSSQGLSTGDDAEDEEVPDVLYSVEYVGASGISIYRKSDKPLDDHAADHECNTSKKRPIIEISTFVNTNTNTSRYVQRPRTHPGYVSRGKQRRRDYHDEDIGRIKGNAVGHSDMIIHSKHLKNALCAVVGYYPGVDFLSYRVSVPAPYRVLLHHYEALERYKLQQPRTHDQEYKETTIKHIDVLLSFLMTTAGARIEEEEARWFGSSPKATFDYFWVLMKPGEVIYRKEDTNWTPYVVSQVWDSNDSHGYKVTCWNIEYVAGRMDRRMTQFDIPAFYGEQAIHTLPVIPARYFPGGEKAAAEKQIKLGKMYWELSKRPAYKEYDGVVVGRDSTSGGYVSGRLIVDADGFDQYGPDGDWETARRRRPVQRHDDRARSDVLKDQLPKFKPRCGCAACGKQTGPREEELGPFAGFEDIDPNKDSPPNNDLYFLVTINTIPVFVLGERRWTFAMVEDLKEVKSDPDSFKYLVLDEEVKLTVKSLIGKFASSDGKVSPWPSDFVKNKGEGRIFLLHGSPGVGKTCTAECVAELTRRPLLSLTSGDISTYGSSASVERTLSYFLELGVRWGALVLIDEADVYLEERRTKDLHRNGLVSIFLRALEYFKGVLFLTTNRIGAFDHAFTSRIHVALYYRRLTDEDRVKIWMNNFERLERDSAGKCFVPNATRHFAYDSDDVRALNWNGREIRNALQTAVALAETEALDSGLETVTVSDKHIRAVTKMSRGFKEFMGRRKANWRDAVVDVDDDGACEDSGEDRYPDSDANSDSD